MFSLPISSLAVSVVVDESSTCRFNAMSQKQLAPKNKPDYVAALLPMTALSKEYLEGMHLEKLRLIYQSLKPAKKAKPLPSNWKRFSKAGLLELYINHAAPWLGVDATTELDYVNWSRDRMIVELEYFATEMIESGEMIKTEPKEDLPMCQHCQVPMVKRVHRLTGEEFWGCVVFPDCRFTLAMSYHGMETAKAQAMLPVTKTAAKSMAKGKSKGKSKQPQKVWDSNEEMNGDARARKLNFAPTESDVESWKRVDSALGSDLTEEELNLIRSHRQAQLLNAEDDDLK